jgi:hypothetical protein
VEVAVTSVSNVEAIKTIFKFPQKPHGTIYLASWTLPFTSFSYVIKVQCNEFGTTGIREAAVLDKLLASGKFDIKKDMPMVGSIAADEKYDKVFPQHPLSRARAYMRHIAQTVQLDAEVLNAPRFRI